MPVIVKEVAAELLEGPVLVTIEYSVVSGQEAEFIEAIRKYSRTRRRDGAYQWGIYRDTEVANRFVEIFLVDCRKVTITSCYASKWVWRIVPKFCSAQINGPNLTASPNPVLCLRALFSVPS